MAHGILIKLKINHNSLKYAALYMYSEDEILMKISLLLARAFEFQAMPKPVKAPLALLVSTYSLYIENYMPKRCTVNVPHDPFFLMFLVKSELMTQPP